MSTIKSISDIEHSFYINLENRPDRREHVEQELPKIGLKNPQRFEAIQMEIGAIGCSLSHLKCLEIAKENNWDHVLICEDDIVFLNPELFIQQMNTFLENHDDWDVVFLGGHNQGQYIPVDDSCVQVHKCQTTTGYLVKSHYYDKLIHVMKEGAEMLEKEPYHYSSYAVDRYWFRLQELDKWYLIVPLTVTQKEDYSNIENRSVNYSQYLLSLDT
jgi:glycosyl transferase family 25